MTELEKSIKILMEHTQHYIPIEDLEHLYAVIEASGKLAEYEIAEAEGRLVVLPKCNIGDTVYIPIDFQNKIYTGKIEGFEYAKMRNTWVVKIRTDGGKTGYEAFDDLEKTFFLNAENAKKALKTMDKGEMMNE